MKENPGSAAAEQFGNALNTFGNGPIKVGWVEGMERQHRTLQQQVFQTILLWIYRLAENKASGNFDLRNERSCEIAAKIVDALGEDVPRLPYI